jgi:hypothetical protein
MIPIEVETTDGKIWFNPAAVARFMRGAPGQTLVAFVDGQTITVLMPASTFRQLLIDHSPLRYD